MSRLRNFANKANTATLQWVLLHFLQRVKLKNIPMVFLRKAPIHLFLHLDPNSIQNRLKSGLPRQLKFYSVQDGNWDQKLRAYDQAINLKDASHNTYAFQLLRKFLRSNESERESFMHSKEFLAALKYLEGGNSYKVNTELRSEDDLEVYLKNYLEIYKSIELNGYKEELTTGVISLAVTRNGELLKFIDGRHRFEICRLLNVKQVKFQLRLIHYDFLMKHFGEMSIHQLNAIEEDELRMFWSED